MEKFGIFELLDALSALFPQEAGEPFSDGTQANSGATEDAADHAPSPDPAFAPPDYGASPDSAAAKPAPEQDNTALGSLLARHETLSRRISEKKPPR